jgi:hypothetical protein
MKRVVLWCALFIAVNIAIFGAGAAHIEFQGGDAPSNYLTAWATALTAALAAVVTFLCAALLGEGRGP